MDDIMTQDNTQTDSTDTSQQQTDTSAQTQQTDTLLSDSTQQTTDQTQQTQDTVLTQPVSPVKADGTFIKGWRDTLPEDIRNDTSLDVIKTFPDMAKRMVNAVKKVGKDKVVLPNDKSTPEEWNSFYEAIGRPKTHTGYTTPEIPEELSDIYTESVLEESKQFAHGIGVTQKQFEEYLKFDISRSQALIAGQDEAEAKAKREARLNAEKELRQELGAAYDERMHAANRLITEGIDKENERLEFSEKYGNDVAIIRLLSNVGARMSEHTALIGELTRKTPNEIEARIAELRKTKGYMQINSDMSKEERQRITDEIQELTKQLHPAKTG